MPHRIDVGTLVATKGLRITEPPRIIARVLSEADDHPTVEHLHIRVSALDPGISIATIFGPSAVRGRGTPRPA